MENIVWFNKKSLHGNPGKKCDISVQVRKRTGKISIIFRNNIHEEITTTQHLRVGLSPNDKNKLYFMASDPRNGWKLTPTNKNSPKGTAGNMSIAISDDKLINSLRRFEGDYNADITEDNIIYIDRRNVI